MKLVTFEAEGRTRAGVVKNGAIVDLTSRMEIGSLRALFAKERLDKAAEIAGAASPDYGLEAVRLRLPIEDPPKILCVGVNYANRNEEYKDGAEAPRYPSLFMRSPLSLVAHGEPLVIPLESEQLDYEGEIALVIGKAGRRIPRERALDHAAGVTIVNEGSVRDWMRHGKFNVTQGKNFDQSGSVGPWIETDIPDVLRVETRVNGEVRQSDTTASMIFDFRRLIEYISTFCTLLPGDIIATGTPTGAGARFDPPRWLKAGDIVEVNVEGVGTLRNPVVRVQEAT